MFVKTGKIKMKMSLFIWLEVSTRGGRFHWRIKLLNLTSAPRRIVWGYFVLGRAVKKWPLIWATEEVNWLLLSMLFYFWLLKVQDPAVTKLLFLCLQNEVPEKGIMHSVTVNVHSVITSAILALLCIKNTCGLGGLLLLQIGFNSHEFRWSDYYIRHSIKLNLEQNTDLSMFIFYHNSWICSLCIFLRTKQNRIWPNLWLIWYLFYCLENRLSWMRF